NAELGRMVDQPLPNVDNFAGRNRQPSAFSQPARQQFIGQHAQMLGIVAKLYHIEISIRAAHQVSLSATPHPANVLNCNQWQLASRAQAYDMRPLASVTRDLPLTSREHAQKFHLILFTLTSGYGFADCERNGHRHDAVIMRAARRTRASVRVPDKGPKLVQHASAVKHLRRFDQHRREPLNHYRPRGSGGQPTPFRPLVVDIRTVLRFQMSQYSMAVIVALDGDQRSVVTRRERDHFASQVARGEMPMQFGALQSRLTLDYLSASIVAFRPSPGRINSNDVIVPIDRRHPGCQTSVFLQLNRLAATFKLTVNKLELKDALSRCSKARDRIFRIL